MAQKQLTILGTASHVPTKTRALNSLFLRWENNGILFDPSEGTQRQLLMAGIPSSAITHIAITHLHADHSLGLPGVLQRMEFDGVKHDVHLMFPKAGQEFINALRAASANETIGVIQHPVDHDGLVADFGNFEIHTAALDHRVETYGWRVQEKDGVTLLPNRLASFGIKGPMIRDVQRDGSIEIDGRTVTLGQVSKPKPGQSFAYASDTRFCQGAIDLARNVDLLVTDSTYMNGDEASAEKYGHMTAGQAGEVAKLAHAKSLVLTHFSQRYADVSPMAKQAREHTRNVTVAEDLMTIDVPSRALEGLSL